MSDLISTRGHEHIDLNNPSVRSLYEKRTPSIFNTQLKHRVVDIKFLTQWTL